MKRQQEHDAAVEALNAAADRQDAAQTQAERDAAEREISSQSQRLARAKDAAFDVYTAGKLGGSESARGLRARAMMIANDYSLVSMKNRRRASLGGRRLTPEEEKEIDDLHAKMSRLERELEDANEELRKAKLEHDYPSIRDRIRKGKAGPSSLQRHLDEMEQDALAWLATAETLGAPNPRALGAPAPTVDPRRMQAYVTVGAATLGKAAGFAQWKDQMLQKLGASVEPLLKHIFDEAKKFRDKIEAGGSTGNQILSSISPNAIPSDRAIRNLALARIMEGKGESLKELLQTLHKDLSPSVPGITELQIAKAIATYGKLLLPSENQYRRKLADLINQARFLSQASDAAAGIPPLKTGNVRDKMTDKAREMQREVDRTMRDMKIVTDDPVRQLKTALDKVRTGLGNLVRDLQDRLKRLKAGEPVPSRKAQPVERDNIAKDLRAQADKLLDEIHQIEGPGEISDEQRLKIAMDAVERSIKWYDERIGSKDFSDRPKAERVTSPELEAKRKVREQLADQFKELQAIHNPGLVYEKAVRVAQIRIDRELAKVRDKIARQDFSRKPKREALADEKLLKTQAELERERRKFRIMLEKDKIANLPFHRKVLRKVLKYNRAWLISGIAVLEKLMIAANARAITTPAEDLALEPWRHVPGIGGIIKQSPRYGAGFNAKLEAKAIVRGMVNAIKNMPDRMATGKSNWEEVYGKESGDDFHDLDPHWTDFIGHIHMVLKSPAVEAEFIRSYGQRDAWAIANGIDVDTEAWKLSNGIASFEDSKRAKLMQDNVITGGVNAFLRYLENKGAPEAAELLRIMAPLMKVSTNFAIETGQYAAGLPYALGAAIPKAVLEAKKKGMPEETATNIARLIAKGSIGAAIILLLLYTKEARKMGGGYYQENERRKPGDLRAEQIRNLPQTAAHTPALEGTLQFAATIQRLLERPAKKSGAHKGEETGAGEATLQALGGIIEHLPMIEAQKQVKGDNWKQAVAGRVVPQFVNDAAKMTDRAPGKDDNPKTGMEMIAAPGSHRVTRKPRTLWESIKAAIPGMRQTVPTASTNRPAWARTIPTMA
jgi:hypothetical protein